MKYKLAQRMQSIHPSPTLSLTAKAKQLKADGHDVVSFGAGEPDFDTPQNIKDAAIKAINNGVTKYTPVPGTNELKDAIIAKLKRDNHVEYTRDEILVSNGGKHGLFNIAMALLEEGDEVIIPAPYWVSYPEQVRVMGATPVIIPTSDQDDFKINAQQLENAITAKTKFVIINSPSNPTGVAYNKNELQSLAEVCLKKNVLIVSDEIYEHIVYDDFKHVSIASFSPEFKDITLISNGASKCYSMTGWRMGFTAGPQEIIKAMNKLQAQSTSNVCSITQAACVEAFAGPQDAVLQMRAAFQKRRKLIVNGLNNIPGINCKTPQGAFYVFPNVSEVFGKTTKQGKTINSSEDFCFHLLEDHGVAVVHGSAFGAEGYLRMSYATDEATITEGLKRIANAVKQLS
ncbi:MAG: pyridoxal phosphate-dependent aminotransferase [Deltaproteobacteria bacterium]|nr:pyridoxal phosphate-dependent aminotransferase [Deltaproteobacteria bacterium]